MTTHLHLALWALRILWGLKRTWPVDRLRLWKKSFNLYLAFLAFTDADRPPEQLKRAMLCAILSAVYDYDSDWTSGSRTGRNILPLLQLVESEEARILSVDLFRTKVTTGHSEDGLERGSVALRVYWLVINSQWTRGYSPEQIDDFGRKLQILDDLLDLEEDRLAGHKNCFLRPDRAQEFVAEIEEFLKSGFYRMLKENSKVYRMLEDKAREKLRAFGMRNITFKQLWATGRPATGLYALLLSFVSFGFYEGAPWMLRVLTSLAFAGLTMSIMTFNDWVDGENDRKKGKTFASEHPQELMQYWLRLLGATALALVPIAYWSVPLAGFLVLVWGIGLLYSYTRRWYLVNNLLVALCSGSPALCGTVYHAEIRWVAACTFGIFMTLIFINEQYKDIEDREVDRGYKATMPVKQGTMMTALFTILFIYITAMLFVFHPNTFVKYFGIGAVTVITFHQAAVLLHPEWIKRPMRTMNRTLKVLLIVLIIT